jgi:hypothetical protein
VKKILVLFLVAGSLTAKSQGGLDSWLASSAASQAQIAHAKNDLNSFIGSLSKDKRSDASLLRKTFRRVQARYLKSYEAYSDFDQIFQSGKYDCLTATALFSYVLDELDYSYGIIETNYHIFLMVQTSNGEVMIETTDRVGGFVTNRSTIAKRTGDYRKNILSAPNPGRCAYQYSFKLYQSLSPEKVTGLMYFNQAVKAYNRQDWLTCAKQLEKANALYSSPRCAELGHILIKTVLENEMSEETKASCLRHLAKFWISNPETVASN